MSERGLILEKVLEREEKEEMDAGDRKSVV